MMVSETPTKIMDIFSFQGAGERNEGKKRRERATNDKSTIFR